MRALLLALLVAAACSRTRPSLPVEPGVTFAAHRAGDALLVDRARAGETGVVAPPGRLGAQQAADLVLTVGDETRAALWVIGRSRILVRREASTIAAHVGEVLSEWDDGALRLTLHPRTGPPLQTDAFVGGSRTGAARLARAVNGPAHLQGAYRAVVRDAAGTPVGWMRVEVGRSETVPRVFDAVLPAEVDDGLAAAAAVALDAEIGWIEDHAAR